MNQINSKIIPISLSLRLVTVFIIKGTRSVLVDTGYPGSERMILRKMIHSGIRPEEIGMILITHGHTDHFGSAAAFKEKTGAKVAIHKLDADNLRNGGYGRLCPTGMIGRLLLSFISDKPDKNVRGLEPE